MPFMTPGKALALAAFFLALLLLAAIAPHLNLLSVENREGVTVLLAVLAFATALAGFLAYLGYRRLLVWIEQVTVTIAEANQGDLTAPLPAAEAAGAAALALYEKISGLVGHFRKTIVNLQETAATIATMSAQMNDNSARLVGAVETQANGVIDTTATVAEITVSIERTVEDIEKLTRSSGEVSTSIMEMAASIEEVALGMNHLMEATDQVSASITEMTASIHETDGTVEILNKNTINAASSIVQMDHSIKQVQESVQSTVAVTNTVLQDAEAGKRAVDATIAGTNQIQISSQIALDAIVELSRRTASIDAIIRVIDEVTGTDQPAGAQRFDHCRPVGCARPQFCCRRPGDQGAGAENQKFNP
jgi:methyl-accepting chemotaxis protein